MSWPPRALRAWLPTWLLLLAQGRSALGLCSAAGSAPGSRLVSASSLAELPADIDAPGLLNLLSSLRKRREWRVASSTLWSASTRERLVQPIHYNVVLAALACKEPEQVGPDLTRFDQI